MPLDRSTKHTDMRRSLILPAQLMIAAATAASGIWLFEIESFGGRHFPVVASSVW
jgi:hypothetical protein